MSDTKNCLACDSLITRDAGCPEYQWKRRRYCDCICAQQFLRQRKKSNSGGYAHAKPANAPITRPEAEEFCSLVASGMEKHAAARKVGRVNSDFLMRACVRFGLVPEPVKVLAPVAQPSPEPPRKIKRVDPLPPGAPETWGAMMPDLKWADAQRQIAQMGGR